MLSKKVIILDYYFLFWDKVWATKPKTSGNKPKWNGNDDLGYVSQIFLPKTMGNDTVPCGFVYMIAPKVCHFYFLLNIFKKNTFSELMLNIFLLMNSVALIIQEVLRHTFTFLLKLISIKIMRGIRNPDSCKWIKVPNDSGKFARPATLCSESE